MPSTLASSAAYALAILPLFTQTTHAQALNAMTYQGCYSSSQPLTDQGPWTYQTSGYCQPICVKQGQAVLGLSGGSDCWCGDMLPSPGTKVGDEMCSTPCNGYDKENCGGNNYWSVYLSGTTNNVASFGGDSSSSSGTTSSTTPSSTPPATTPPPTSSSAEPSVITSVAPGTTVVVTQAPAQTGTASATPTSAPASKPNVAGIAAGVVVGVIAIAAICIGAFLLMRRRKRRQAEDEYKRATQVNAFMGRSGNEGKAPGTAYSNMSDQRLDAEAAAGRRNSSGSIADNQDYSRKILRVANPDNS
ncbi:hypothetical protein B0A48_12651 [Cryoendolithus antarcticus]|uniref:WSC domain-containing protein n=1 Tax=Cryoendolithus antarcticus TaxID=1507870 RepID=A0A1V8SR09_9PEZI|nr:hypothetical protein B0A48_12651 [Cryoendolithus antarcticus]